MLRFNIDDTAMILIDHQVGTNTWAKTTPLELLQRNVLVLAKFAKGTGMPIVLTSSQETNVNVQGPLRLTRLHPPGQPHTVSMGIGFQNEGA